MLKRTNILCFFVISSITLKCADNCNECSRYYEPPGNIKFPYGDEGQLNTDIADAETNTIICFDKGQLRTEQGRCPFPPEDPEDMRLTNPYIKCPDFPELITPVAMTVGDPLPPPSVQCQNCDLKLTQDDTAVLLKCLGCYDLPSNDRIANFTGKDLLYKVYFIEIANYTSVNVQGRDNF